MTQLRADVAASLLLGTGLQPTTNPNAAAAATEPAAAAAGAGSDADPECASTDIGKIPTPRADVLVTVPVFSLLGLTDEPAVLDGFGPIPPSMARKLVADGAESFYRVLIDPRDGAPLEIGRTRYRLPETIKKWIRLRDAKCSFPGCTNHTPDNDTDHLTAWHHGGTTDVANLAQLCPKHGWTSPTGRHYKPEQHDPQPTHWPQWPVPAAVTQSAEPGPEDFPPWEPDDANLIDLNDLSPEDPFWAEFFETPFALSE
jgi:hypothetical protein